MEVQEIHRGRLIDHIHIVTDNLEASKKFYKTVTAALAIPFGGEGADYFWIDELFISSASSESAQGKLTGRIHLAFQASSKEMVQAFYRAALEVGAKDNGKPGERPYHPGYYGAFVLDPDGNNIEAVYHGPAKRSAESIKLTW